MRGRNPPPFLFKGIIIILTDSYYEIGSSHKVCEDFALHGSIKNSQGVKYFYSIVCDGCSSSLMDNGKRLPLNVDTGARLLAIMAKQALRELVDLRLSPGELYRGIQGNILSKCKVILPTLSLSSNVIDSTLLIALASEDGMLWSGVWGDGVVAVHKKNGEIILYNVVLDSGAPSYLSYLFDKERKKMYEDEFGNGNKSVEQTIISSDKNNVETEPARILFDPSLNFVHTTLPFGYIYFDFNSELMGLPNPSEIESISVLSDGILSFRKNLTDPVPLDVPAVELIDFKSKVGEFVVKRMNLAKKKFFNPNNMTHYDDLAISSILSKEEQNG